MTMQMFADKRSGATRAVRAGNHVFIGGLMATDASGRIVAGGVRERGMAACGQVCPQRGIAMQGVDGQSQCRRVL